MNVILIEVVIFQLFQMSNTYIQREMTIEEKNLRLNNREEDLRVLPTIDTIDSGDRHSSEAIKSSLTSYVTKDMELSEYDVRQEESELTDKTTDEDSNIEDKETDNMVKWMAPKVFESQTEKIMKNLSEAKPPEISTEKDNDSDVEEDIVLRQSEPEIESQSKPKITNFDNNGNNVSNNFDNTTSGGLSSSERQSTLGIAPEDEVISVDYPIFKLGNDSDDESDEDDDSDNENVTQSTSTTLKPFEKIPQKTIPELIIILIVMEVSIIIVLIICWLLTSYYAMSREDKSDKEDKLDVETTPEPKPPITIENEPQIVTSSQPPPKILVTKSPTPSESSVSIDEGLNTKEEEKRKTLEDKPPVIMKVEPIFSQ